MFGNLAQVLKYVFNPSRVFLQDLEANTLGLTPPIIDELAKESHLRGDTGNSMHLEDIVVCIPTHLISDDLVWVTLHHAVREWCVLPDVLEQLKIPWVSVLDVVVLATVVWPNEVVSWSVTVDDEFQLVFLGWDEVSHGSRLWLGESLISWPVITANLCEVWVVLWFPVNTIVTVEISSWILITTHSKTGWVHVLSLVNNFAFFFPMLLYKCRSISVDHWDKIVYVFFQHLLELYAVLDNSTVDQLHRHVKWYLRGQELTSMGRSSDQDCLVSSWFRWWIFCSCGFSFIGGLLDLLWCDISWRSITWALSLSCGLSWIIILFLLVVWCDTSSILLLLFLFFLFLFYLFLEVSFWVFLLLSSSDQFWDRGIAWIR